ncbi:hypothetical protein EJ03DRAFT_384925 [Teratosphaeria nubilosa]|uniref:Glutamyl-tRNA amidotransferase complex subunit Gta3 domain-containing protein n=1 Tax=Teratosphaeria nubilosa TaxID=161662 RepID=A0A6G1L0Z4_9PEZI|nr:hypothetical protein EJ03DRAFT_384925 [Teratosphaeria nubilosa]
MNTLRAALRRSLPPQRCLRTSASRLSSEPPDIDQLLSKPAWSISSLLPLSDPPPTDTPSITPKQLHHLLRLSALPPPASPEEEARMLSTLTWQLHFVREIQKVDTTGVEPLTSLRDETAEGRKEAEIGLEQLKEAMEREEVKGKVLKRIRRRRGGNVEKEVEDWDVLRMAGKNSARCFVVEANEHQCPPNPNYQQTIHAIHIKNTPATPIQHHHQHFSSMDGHKSNAELAADLARLVEKMHEHALDKHDQMRDLIGQVRAQNRRLDGLLDEAARARARERRGEAQATRDDSEKVANVSSKAADRGAQEIAKGPTAAQKPAVAPPTSDADAETLRSAQKSLASLAQFKSRHYELAIRAKVYVGQFGQDHFRWTERERGLLGLIASLTKPLMQITGVDSAREYERWHREVVEAVGDGESRAFNKISFY